jgi:acetyl esterase/lipase
MRINRLLVALAIAGATFVCARGADVLGEKNHVIVKVRSIAYCEGEDADQKRHRLDLYLPKDQKDFPVVLFVHGGAWTIGSKDVRWHADIGKFFASHGIGAVVINYRLSPGVTHLKGVKHPEHIKDVARAFAWTKKNIRCHGGRSDGVFVAGHSAGGHLAALLATDESYLRAQGCACTDIKGVIGISGVYDIPPKRYKKVFGNDPDDRKNASPINHVRQGLPPFLIVYADHDFPVVGKMSETFCTALKEKKTSAELVEIEHRNHITILIKCSKEDDPCGEAMLDFLRKYEGK